MNKIYDLLQGYIKEGYCLHGSPHRIAGAVEPRQATCLKNAEGNLCAVYAEPCDARIPILMALTHQKDNSKKFRSAYECDSPEELLKVTGENIQFDAGYVYVLPSGTFRQVGCEYVSLEAVEPLVIVEVDPTILSELPNIDIQIEI